MKLLKLKNTQIWNAAGHSLYKENADSKEYTSTSEPMAFRKKWNIFKMLQKILYPVKTFFRYKK